MAYTPSISCKILTRSLQTDDLCCLLFTIPGREAEMFASKGASDGLKGQLRMVMQENSERLSVLHTASA
jgi:hypothetical protein